MAATKVEKNAALAALTSAALSLPGLQAVAAVPAANINANVSYGHYEENNNRMKVDVYHADAVIPLTDRIELSFSLDRDTYSGATPMFSLPITLTNLPRYTTKGTEYADLVSAASGAFGADKLTSPEGLDTFISQDTRQKATLEIYDATSSLTSTANSQYLAKISDAKTTYSDGVAIANNLYATEASSLSNHYSSNALTTTSRYNDDQYLINQQYQDALDAINPLLSAREKEYLNDKSDLSLTYQSDNQALDTQYTSTTASLSQKKQDDFSTYVSSHLEPISIKVSTNVDFGYKPSKDIPDTVLTDGAYYGNANDNPQLDGTCPDAACIIQNGMLIGTISDPTGPNAHLHQGGSESDRAVAYHNDSGGIYIRALDSSAFSFDSIKISSPYSAENPYAKYLADGVTLNPNHDPNLDYFEILGFNTAANPNLASGNGTCENYATCVAYHTVENGFNGTLAFSSINKPEFKNVKAVWIHYAGTPNVASVTVPFKVQIDNIAVSPSSDWTSWKTNLAQYESNLNTQYNSDLSAATTKYNQDLASLKTQYDVALAKLTSEYETDVVKLSAGSEQQVAEAKTARDAALANLKQEYDAKLTELTQQRDAALAELKTTKDSSLTAIEQKYQEDLTAFETEEKNSLEQIQLLQQELQKQSIIASYRNLVDSLVPNGTPTVQRFAMQPMETRSMPQFTTRYYFDSTTLSFSGGLSDEPDFLSNFGSVNVNHEFNDKLTTVSGGYGKTSNVITRSASHAGHEDHSHYASPNYPELNETSDFDSFNLGLSQVLSKNSLFQSTINFTNQQGYLSNPYKYVYIRGEVTPEEYYQIFSNLSGEVDWNSITQLEMVGVELFRENRPRERNLWSFSNQLNQHIPELDASVHFDHRFYTDDWNINSHTFELKWFQSLPGGLTVTPSLRYYSQSEAEFFAPYFLAPRADGYYSSDFRLSAFGNLTPGITITKEFARGITLETGFEYTFHSGGLKLGGGGVGDYADFEYFMAHANLNIDFAARPFSMGGGAGDHHMHHHHHGAPIPAGVMFGHMMSQADEIMVGYRYQYGVQSGSMLHGSDQISDALLVSNACAVSDGCLYKPTKMHMQMHMLDLMYSPTDWLTLMIMPQLMSMDMTMSDSLQPNNEGEHGGSKHTSNDIGDTLAVAMVKLMDDGTHHVHAGIGMSAPTGAIDAEISQGRLKDNGASTEREAGTAVLQDYGMQLGSGTWDFKPSLTYTGHIDDWGWGGQLNGTKRLQKNEYGYVYGDIFQATGWGSYNIFNWLSATIRGVYTWQDRIRGETNQPHETTSPVDFPANYGGRFWDVGFGLNASIPEGRFAGNNFSVEWLQPVATDFNGYQLDRDGALTATWSFSF